MSLPREDVLDRLQAMMKQEVTGYRYESYFPPMLSAAELERRVQLNVSWREKICQWSYNVVDHFDLPREIVAISLDIFDRYLATRGNECSGNLALLASLTTLHISIKIHSDKNIKISTLASLSRGQFGPKHIEQMEWQIFSSLGWKLHPPTLFGFISHLLMLFPTDVHHSVRKEIFEVAIYMAELSVCDSFFVKIPASAIALASIFNVMEDLPFHRLSHRARDVFWRGLYVLHSVDHVKMQMARDRLKAMFATASHGSSAGGAPGGVSSSSSPTPIPSDQQSITSSPTSVTDAMQVCNGDDHVSIASSMDTSNNNYSYFGGRGVVGSSSTSSSGPTTTGEVGGGKNLRYSPSPLRNTIPASPMAGRRRAPSPIIGFHQ